MRGTPRTKLARTLRRRSTDAEQRLWSQLRSRQLNCLKFKRQVPIARFVVDFASLEHHIVIELDGGQHSLDEAIAHDAARTRQLEAMRYVVLRFSNADVLTNLDGVLAEILAVADNEGPVPPHPVPLPSGERGRTPTSRSKRRPGGDS